MIRSAAVEVTKMFSWFSKKSLSAVKAAVEQLEEQRQTVRMQIMVAKDARMTAIAELSSELSEINRLSV